MSEFRPLSHESWMSNLLSTKPKPAAAPRPPPEPKPAAPRPEAPAPKPAPEPSPYVMTLREWMRKPKSKENIIVNASDRSGRSEWLPFTIGMQWSFMRHISSIDTFHRGNHDKLLMHAISTTTDKRRRPSAPNRASISRTLSRYWKNELIPANRYFHTLSSYKFIASPEGNGIDCHRHYEALMAGCIPIVEHHDGIKNVKYPRLPILYTRDYSEITPDYLKQKYNEMIDTKYDFSKLYLSTYAASVQQEMKTCSRHWCEKMAKAPYPHYRY